MIHTFSLRAKKDKRSDKILYDVHFWLGATTSQDEAGTAAFKTVELDDFFDGAPIQHRECQDNESALFLSYFKVLKLLQGGIISGFNKVEPQTYVPRLLHIKGKKKVRTVEVDIKISSLNSGDVFVLDGGLLLYQYQGKKAGKHEKTEGGRLTQAIDDEREGKPEKEVFSQIDKPDDTMGHFFSYFQDDLIALNLKVKVGDVVSPKNCKLLLSKITESEGGDDAAYVKDREKRIMVLSDSDGELQYTEVAKGSKCKKSVLRSDDVFIFDVGDEVFVWIGKGASKKEKSNAMSYASKYLKQYARPMKMPVTALYEGGESEVFEASFN